MSVRKTQHIKSINEIEVQLHKIKDRTDPAAVNMRKDLFNKIATLEVKLRYNLD